MSVWQQYETEKRKIQSKGLSPKEYERAIKALCDRLRV